MGALIVVVAIGVAVAGAVWSYQMKRKRREALASVAAQLGLAYSPEDVSGCLGLPFTLLQRGDGRGSENVLSGTWQGMAVREFDYWYYEESTDSKGNTTRTTSTFSCAVSELDAALSPIVLERENLLTRLADSIGLHDVEFELEDFNRAFTVRCKDRKFANDLVDQRMMQWLLRTDRGFGFEASGRWLLAYSKRRMPTELIPLLGTLQQFRDHVPRVVFELYGLPATG